MTAELNSKYSDVLYLNSVRWLSCGQVLDRFCELFSEIQLFLEHSHLDEQFSVISTAKWKAQLYFLADITKHLNDLNLKLQGKKQFIWDLAKSVNEFKLKLIAFKNDIKENDYAFFPKLLSNLDKEEFELGYNNEIFTRFLDLLIDQFNSRFSQFQKSHLAFKFLKNPFTFDKNNIQNLSDLFNTKKSHLEFDIALIDAEDCVPNETSDALWNRLCSTCNFMVLNTIVQKFLCMFGSTYVCESTFSSLARRKNKYRSLLAQQNLESELRCELCQNKPDFSTLTENKACQQSH